jgi:hypothetical protein
VFRWINGKEARQYGLDFGLWTRSVVADPVLGDTIERAEVHSIGYQPFRWRQSRVQPGGGLTPQSGCPDGSAFQNMILSK